MYLFVNDIQQLENLDIKVLNHQVREVFRDETRTDDFFVLDQLGFEIAQFYYPNAKISFAEALPQDIVIFLL